MDQHRAAILELIQAKDAVLDLGKQIALAMEASHAAQVAHLPEDQAPYVQTRNFLTEAYQLEHDDDGDRYFTNHDGNPAKYLEGLCAHALRAHQLIQERKQAKKRLAAARRRITMLGRQLQKESTR